jgi:gliding motility-associated-like protein
LLINTPNVLVLKLLALYIHVLFYTLTYSVLCMPGPRPDLLKRFFLGFVFLGLSRMVAAQTCECPKPTECNPCAGGISSITLRYTGTFPVVVTGFDDKDMVFVKSVVQDETFVLNGKSGTFKNDANLFVAGLFNVKIKANCSLNFDPSEQHGFFTIVSVVSKNGGTMCCSPGAGGPPTIINCPSNINVSAGTSCSAVVTWTPPQTLSTCNLLSLTSTHEPGATFPIGQTKVIYTATDMNNNKSTCNFNVNVSDNSGPVATGVPGTITVAADQMCNAKVDWTAPVFTDNCQLASVTSTHAPGSVFRLGTTDVTYTARDKAGNSTNIKFSVVVADLTGPEANNCPNTITLTATRDCKARAMWPPPVFTDDCSRVTVTSTHKPGNEFPIGTTDVTYTAKDDAGNSTICTFQVIVKDIVPPVITRCPADISMATSSSSGNTAVEWTPPMATDECTLTSFESNHQPGDIFPIGATEVTYTATDKSGNTTTCGFTVKIEKEETPLDITQLVTPDGNGSNDTWFIGNIEKYPTNKVIVVDRWGSVIYSTTGYDNAKNAWNGESMKGGPVPTGTYFYTLSIHSGTTVTEKKGFIEVVR